MKQGTDKKEVDDEGEKPVIANVIPEFAKPPPLEARRDEPGSDGRFGVGFTSELVVPPNLPDLINKQERRRRMLRSRALGDSDTHSSLDEAFEEYDRKRERKKNGEVSQEAVQAEISIEAEWDGEFDDSVQLVQVIGIPGVDAEDLGLVWEIEQGDGKSLNFKLNFTNPILVS